MNKLITLFLLMIIASASTFAQTITTINPDQGYLDEDVSVTITGSATSFTQGSFSSIKLKNTTSLEEINLININIINDVTVSALAQIPNSVAAGLWDVEAAHAVDGTMTLTEGFTVLEPVVELVSIDPDSSYPGTNVNVTITGSNTSFTQGSFSSIKLKNPISLEELTFVSINVVNDVTVSAVVQILNNVETGEWDLETIHDVDGTLSLPSAFTVYDNSPALTSINPDSAYLGETANVMITGFNTNFTQGSFSSIKLKNATSLEEFELININIINDVTATATAPVPSSVTPGLWDLEADHPVDGILTLSQGFKVIDCQDGCVWPGDCNFDGVANYLDILPIGVGYGTSGTSRINANLDWYAQPSLDWVDDLASGVNYKHIDADGNALIDANDTMGFVLNYGFTHAKTSDNTATEDAAKVTIEWNSNIYEPGDTAIGTVRFGDAQNPIQDVYGLAFTVDYDIMQVDTANFTYSNSWFGTLGTDVIYVDRDVEQVGQLQVGVVRTNHQNVSGEGIIGVVEIVIADDLSGKELDQIEVNLVVENVYAIQEDETELDVAGEPTPFFVDADPVSTSSLYENNGYLVYPNPANTNLFINSIVTDDQTNVTIYNAVGKIAYSNTFKRSLQVETSSFTQGIYYITLETENNIVTKKISIVK